jgi:hypothetical protein
MSGLLHLKHLEMEGSLRDEWSASTPGGTFGSREKTERPVKPALECAPLGGG